MRRATPELTGATKRLSVEPMVGHHATIQRRSSIAIQAAKSFAINLREYAG